MKPQKILEELEKFLISIGINIEKAMGTVKGGFCRIREDLVIVINRKTPVEEQITVIVQAIHWNELDYSELKPSMREYIDSFKEI
ncbi:MAG: hypothetical protein PHE86_05480 [Candidatus Marinimicrobia bacterium]|nr:hypothetical protein [Candidatus Neomarinimicrobiota bacterium]MDD5581617.1 hypothetical protein [Candidatus Neomarinimicrobiota bacterium]